jgi:hypothetical protein
MQQTVQARLDPLFCMQAGIYHEVPHLIIEGACVILTVRNIPGTFLIPSSIEPGENGKKSPKTAILLRSVYVPYPLS